MRSSRVRRASNPPLFRQRGVVRAGFAGTLRIGPAFLREDVFSCLIQGNPLIFPELSCIIMIQNDRQERKPMNNIEAND